jgi:hypothetical protein
MACSLLVFSVLAAAREWPALQQLKLKAIPDGVEQEQFTDHCTAAMLSGLPPLQQVQQLELEVIGFGASSARQVGTLGQLTRLQINAFGSASDTPADLTALSGMTSLLELELHAAPAVQVAAGPAGPFCFPSSLRSLSLDDIDMGESCVLAWWLPHLAGCPQLQSLHLEYHPEQHASAHPGALVPLLARYNRQLRSLTLEHSCMPRHMDWTLVEEGLPPAEGPVGWSWRPEATLAALPALECLSAGGQLVVTAAQDWQQLAQLPALKKLAGVEVTYAPPWAAGTSLRVLELGCAAFLDGRRIGLLLLACPVLEVADVQVERCVTAAPVQLPAPPLSPHPCLRKVEVRTCSQWGTQAAAEFAALAPVLSGVSDVTLGHWAATSPAGAHCGLPDLSPCTAMTSLMFACDYRKPGMQQIMPEQEDFLSMLATAKQLQRLQLCHAPRLNARVALALQWLLPQLQHLALSNCGAAMPLVVTDPQQQQQQQQTFQRTEEVLAKVKQQLRRSLVLAVGD